MVRKARMRRDVSLSLRASDVDHWWHELDADGSGDLDKSEVKVLLGKMKWSTDDKDIDEAIQQIEMHSDEQDGQVSKEEFTAWFDEQLTMLVDAPFDVFFGTTRSGQYWCVCLFVCVCVCQTENARSKHADGDDLLAAWLSLSPSGYVLRVCLSRSVGRSRRWFVQVLWLKTAVNLLFTFGYCAPPLRCV
jgi:hypothetical protein